jgi:hypothetical protein
VPESGRSVVSSPLAENPLVPLRGRFILVVGLTAVLVGSVSSGGLVSRGRMADVHEAHNRLLVRLGAINILASPFNGVRGLVERFRRSARAAAHLN